MTVGAKVPPAEGTAGSSSPLGATKPGRWLKEVAAEVDGLDRAVSRALASTPTPALDKPMTWLSNSANYSRLWVEIALVLALAGPRGRRGAVHALTAVAVTSAAANLAAKRTFRRARPLRPSTSGRSETLMPGSSSFPSGHTASAFAFASVAGAELPQFALPLYGLATAVAVSRAVTGVHYPSDVLAGGLLGLAVGTVFEQRVCRALSLRRL